MLIPALCIDDSKYNAIAGIAAGAVALGAAVAVALTASAKVTTISPDADNDALRLAVHYAENGDIIEMSEGTYVQCNNGYVAFDGKSVTVKAAEGANVVLQLQVPITIANGGKVTLQGIKIDASRLLEKADWYEHVVYPTDATEGKELVMEGCELYGFSLNKSAIYSAATNTLALCTINNSYFHDNMKSCFFFEGPSIGELSITNSTFANISTNSDSYYAGIIDVRSTEAKVTIDHCTFYNCLSMNTDYVAITMKGPKTENVVISNNIFAFPEATDGQRAIREYVSAKNCLTFNYIKDNGGIHSSVTKTDCLLNTDPLFVDAANGNFKLKGNSPAIGEATDGSNLGDPRWGVEAIVIGEGDNSAALATEGEVFVQVNREFIAGKLYTIALPFTLNDVASVFGQGTVLYEYDKLIEQNDEVVLHFNDKGTSIVAGKPYLILPKQDVDGFTVNNVTLSNSAQTLSFTFGTTTSAMEPVLSVTPGQTTEGKYWLASDTYLYNNTNALPSLRALFTISTQSGIAPRARVALGENVETGLDNNQLPNTNIQKVLENGQLIIIRDGVKYNVQGQVIK